MTNQGRAAARNNGHEWATSVVAAALAVVAHSPDRTVRGLATALGKVARSEQQKMIAAWTRNYLAPGSPGAAYARRLTRQLDPNVRKRFLAGFITNLFFRDPEVSERLKREYGVNAPNLLAISPSMRCNLRCVGCYAGEYDKKDDLPEEVVDRVIGEAEDIGTRVFIVIGGEPFRWKPLFHVIERHPHSVFQVFTNGSMITDEVADRIVQLGNIAPAFSIEGLKDRTEARRGPGSHDVVLAGMERLRDRGGLFSYSAMATRQNLDEIIGDEFVDLMIEKGALYGWYFAYIPVGLNPDLEYMPTPEERNRLREGVNRIRKEKPILVADFWNDGALTGGCLAAGRKYIHINNHGDVEPCVFVHFAVDNIKETSLVKALSSDFFRDLRRMQPFGHNLLRPCPIVDHPGVLGRVVEKHGAYPTHERAESIIGDLEPGLRTYARELKEVYATVWEEEYGWVQRWLSTDGEYRCRTSAGADAEEEVSAGRQ